MGNQNPKPQLSAEKNGAEIEEKDMNQGQQQLTFAQLDKRKFLHQISMSRLVHKAKKSRQLRARLNKIIRIYRLNHRQLKTPTNFEFENMDKLKEFKLKDYSNTRSISFQIYVSKIQVNLEDMRHFGMNVRNILLHLQKLHLSFSGGKIEERGLRDFISELGKHVQLTDFKLALESSGLVFQKSEGKLIKLFTVICKSHPNLQKLTVLHKGFEKFLTDKALVAFGHQISTYLLKLKHLVLSFKYCYRDITDDGLIGFFENLTKNKRGLNHLALRFESFSSITAHKFNLFKSQLSQAFPDLQRLSLNFSCCDQLTLNEDEEQIEVKNPSNLTSLELDFERVSTIGDSGLKSLTRQIVKDFPVLQELTLNLADSANVMEWNSALATNEWSQKLTALRSLNLNLSKCQWFTDMNLESLAIDIRNGFSALESLSLDLSDYSSFTDKNLESLGSAISSSLKNLKRLKLDFCDCQGITDKGFQMLISSIKETKGLKSLSLSFFQHNFTGQGLSTAFNSGLNNLNQLSLNFGKGEYITDRGVKMLFSTIRKMKTLKDLSLYFHRCDRLTNSIFPMLESIVVQNDFAHADQVLINFSACSQVNKYMGEPLQRLASGSNMTLIF